MKKLFFFSFLILALIIAQTAQAQFLDKLKKKVEDKVKKGVEKTIDDTDKQSKTENDQQKKPAEKPKTAQENPKIDQKKTGIENTDKVKETVNKSQSTEQQKESLKAFSNYDFVPGDKVLLFEDFSQDAVGDFPALWTTDVAGEVNTLNIAPGHWFNLNSKEGNYWFMKDIDFPVNFIIEFDIVPKKEGGRYAADLVLFGESSHSEMDKSGDPGTCGLHITIAKTLWETKGYKKAVKEKLSGTSSINLVKEEKVNHVIVWVQGRRVRIYHEGGKVVDMPTNIYEGSKFSRLCFKLYRGASCGSFISNIKITNAAPDIRSKLLTEGKLISYGIYFDINKDIVKPESYASIKEIAAILKENPTVKVKVVGHTDSDGDDKFNLDLSKRRAAAVKNFLVTELGADGKMIETDGKGEGVPVAPNNNSTNKALNRRVEFLKIK